MKIYTKTGDDGTTGLFGGGRVAKDHLRVEAYGSVDEVNSHLGSVRAQGIDPALDAALARVQSDLFALGADLATPPGGPASSKVRRLQTDDAAWLERAIDELDRELPELTSFILPAGSPSAAAVHVARAVCRRAERAVVTLARNEPGVGEGAVVYLNRLSDFLFTLARVLDRRAGISEEPWHP